MNTPAFRLRQNLAIIIEDRRTTAAELCRTTGIAQQVISDWLAGTQPRKLENLYKVASTLKISLEKLCFAQSSAELLSSSPLEFESEKNNPCGWTRDLESIDGIYEVMIRRIKPGESASTE